jgi:hypothetical protein
MRALAGLMVRGILSSTLRRLRSQALGSTPGGIVLGGGGQASWVGVRGAGGCGGEPVSAAPGWCRLPRVFRTVVFVFCYATSC